MTNHTIMKKVMLGVSVFATTSFLGACSLSSKAKEDNQSVKIGILQFMDQQALKDAKEGFDKGLKKAGFSKENLHVDFLNAQGDQSNLKTMSERLKRDKNDLNLAIATPAAQTLKKVDPNTPLLFTAVTDPVSSGLMKDAKKPENVTGVTDIVDVNKQMLFLHHAFKKAKKVGLFYNAAEPSSTFQIKLARKSLKKMGLQVVEKTAATTNDVEQAITALAEKSEVIFIPNDNTAAAAMPTIGKVCEKMKVPVINSDATMVQFAGVATKGISFKDLGEQTAEMAVKILKKEKKINDLPVEAPKKVSLVTNEKRMKLFGLTKDMLE